MILGLAPEKAFMTPTLPGGAGLRQRRMAAGAPPGRVHGLATPRIQLERIVFVAVVQAIGYTAWMLVLASLMFSRPGSR